jgi:hypothetical protein
MSLAALVVCLALATPAFAQSDPHVEKIRREVSKVGLTGQITVFPRAKGEALHGVITNIETDRFEIAEIDLKQKLTIEYADVKKVRAGYAGINLFTGKRAHPPRGARIAATAGVFHLVIGLPIIILASTKD